MIVSFNPGAIKPLREYFILKKGVVGGIMLTLWENFDLLIRRILTRDFLLSSKPFIFTNRGEASNIPFEPALSNATIFLGFLEF